MSCRQWHEGIDKSILDGCCQGLLGKYGGQYNQLKYVLVSHKLPVAGNGVTAKGAGLAYSAIKSNSYFHSLHTGILVQIRYANPFLIVVSFHFAPLASWLK